MTITLARRRRLEHLLLTQLGFAGKSAAAFLGAFCNSAKVGADAMSLAALGEHAPVDRSATYSDLVQVDDAMGASFGFRMTRSGPGPDDDEMVELSDAFRQILNGSLFRCTSEAAGKPTSLEDRARIGLGLVRTACAARAGAAFLYRVAAPIGTIAGDQEIQAAADALAQTIGPDCVFVAAGSCSPVAYVLAAILHIPDDAVAILPAFNFIEPPPAAATDPDEFMSPEVPQPSPIGCVTVDGSRVMAILSTTSVNLVVPVASETRLPPDQAVGFAGSIGPFRIDRDRAIKELRAMTPAGNLSIDTARRVLEMYGYPAAAGHLLAAAEKIAIHRDTSLDVTAGALVTSIAPNLTSPILTRPSRPALFDPDLFVSNPGVSTLIARARHLREGGAKILIGGPVGVGKTALASHLAEHMGMDLVEYRGHQIHGRWLGSSEAKIHAMHAEAVRNDTVIFLDEADAVLSTRFDAGPNQHITLLTVSEFLKAWSSHPLPIIAATNRPEALDPGIMRRFDFVIVAQALPEDREELAYRRIIGCEPPSGWSPIGDTVIADYSLAARQVKMLSMTGAEAATRFVSQARNTRLNRTAAQARVGFI